MNQSMDLDWKGRNRMKQIVFFTGVVLVLCLSVYAQQGVPPGYADASATAANTNLTNVNTYAGTGFNTFSPTNTNLAAAGGGSSTSLGQYDNSVANINELNFPEAEKQRTPIPGLPPIYPGFPRNDAQGPQIYGPMLNGGVEVFKWGDEDKGTYYIKRARQILGCENPLHGGPIGLVGNIGSWVLAGKTGYQAKGFVVSNFPRNVGKRTTEGGNLLPLIVVIHSGKFILADELLYKAGYVCVGNLSILPPANFKGAVVDDSVMKGVYLDLLKPTNVAIAQFIWHNNGQPVTETKTAYIGLGGSTNDRNFGLTVGGGQTNAESFTSTRWPSLMKCWIYDPKVAAKHLAAPAIIQRITTSAESGKPVSPSELLKAVDSGTIYYLEQMKSTTTSNSPAAPQPSPSPAKADAARDAKPLDSQQGRQPSINEIMAASPSFK